MIERLRPGADLEVDGGIDVSTILRAYEAGARVFVAGTSIFGHPGGVAEGLRSLRAALNA
jgi:ribulose-phosphate 3-epimerase